MYRPRRPRFGSDRSRRRPSAYSPHLEEIESRLLPGETVGLGLLASFQLFDVSSPLLVDRNEKLSISPSVFRSTVIAGDTEPPADTRANGLAKNRSLPLTEDREIRSDHLPSLGNDPLTAADALTKGLANDLFDALSLFAPTRPPVRPAPVSTDGSDHLEGPQNGFARSIFAGSPQSSSLGVVPQANGSGRPAAANSNSASVAPSDLGGTVHGGPTILPNVGGPSWSSYAHDAQHTAISDVASQHLASIHWQTPVDLNPQYYGGSLYIHYGSPLVTQANTVIVPVKTGASDGFEVEAFDGGTGALKWTVNTDYSVPSSSWTPPLSVVLTPSNRLYIPGAGGTVYYMDNPDANQATITGQLAFYGISNYDHSYDSNVKICTPLTSDSAGNIYFGFVVSASTPLNLQSGIARMDPTGNGTWVAASTAAGDPGIAQVVFNCAPALSNDQSNLYIAVSGGGFDPGYLLRLDTTTLATTGEVFLLDPQYGVPALLPDIGTASPTVGPDGDVYFGVFEDPPYSNNDRGWLLHFSGDLTQTKTPGAFGWDDTASIVPASMVPSYTGSSAYLVMTKYNNYADIGTGDGNNRLAVLDPNAMMTDPITGTTTVMHEVLTIAGVTPDPDFPDHPGAVREWCINTAAVDPATKSILANSEDGTLYRWDMVTNSFTESVGLAPPTGEAYTPTVIGVDGTVYAVNDATLFAVGA